MTTAVIVLTGSRAWTDHQALEAALLDVWHDALQVGHDGIEMWHGACPEGADAIGDHGVAADWDACVGDCPAAPHRRTKRPGDRVHPGRLPDYCPGAGPRRNALLVGGREVDLCVGAPLGKSYGTRDCMRLAWAAGIPVLLVTSDGAGHRGNTTLDFRQAGRS